MVYSFCYSMGTIGISILSKDIHNISSIRRNIILWFKGEVKEVNGIRYVN